MQEIPRKQIKQIKQKMQFKKLKNKISYKY